MNVDAALDEVAAVGPYFAVSRAPVGQAVRLRQLYAGGPELRARVDATAEALGTTDTRVGASIFFQGLAARLWSPVIGIALHRGVVLDLDPAETAYDQGALHHPNPVAAATDDLPSALYEAVVTRHLELLAAQLQEVSHQVLWGNSASALVGSYGVLARARPDLADLADAGLLRAILRLGRLERTGSVRPEGFRRNSCCLYYRVPNGGLCGDCVLTARPSGRTTR